MRRGDPFGPAAWTPSGGILVNPGVPLWPSCSSGNPTLTLCQYQRGQGRPFMCSESSWQHALFSKQGGRWRLVIPLDRCPMCPWCYAVHTRAGCLTRGAQLLTQAGWATAAAWVLCTYSC